MEEAEMIELAEEELKLAEQMGKEKAVNELIDDVINNDYVDEQGEKLKYHQNAPPSREIGLGVGDLDGE